MHRIIYINIIRSILGIFCAWFGGVFLSLIVVVLSVSAFAYGCYELKYVEEIEAFKNKPYYYTDFVVSFDLLFPIALIALWVVRRMGS